MHPPSLLAFAASITTTLAVSQGFNYGAVNSDGSFRYQADFQREFKLAKSLVGASGFNSARLYTTIQGGSSTNEPIQAIPAAIAEKTTLLLGLWASGGDGFLQAEITALKTAIGKWGSSFTDLVVGISVGSEDLYRISPTGIAAESGYGADPQTVAKYIAQVRDALKGTPLSGSPIGHVDTWTAWVNGSNKAVIDASDWIGVDAYPYFQNTQSNGIENGKSLFEQALADTQSAIGGKEIWITETGWPVSGKTQNKAIPNPENAETYWKEVGCPRFGKVNTWWFTLQDATPTTPNPSFGIVGAGSDKPLFDLSCDGSTSTPPPSSSARAQSSSIIVSSESSVASTVSSAISSEVSTSSSASAVESSTASQPLVSSGGGLSPSQGGGIGPVKPSESTGAPTTGSGPYPTTGSNVSATASAPSIALTTATTIVTGSAPSQPTSAGQTPATVDNGSGAKVLSASLLSGVGALFAAFLIL